jgi:prepilin signal peptidase PulO-like enzyme (type II secretory pathway)
MLNPGDIPPPFDTLWCKALLGWIYGIICGSFITLASYRLPRRLSLITPPSQCPTCHTHLTARDLVPVFSWLVSGGTCSHCHTKISIRYLLIELITGFFGAVAFVCLGYQFMTLVAFLGIIIAMTGAIIKLERSA